MTTPTYVTNTTFFDTVLDTTYTKSVTVTGGSNSMLMVAFGATGQVAYPNISGITYNSVALTKLQTASRDTYYQAEIWYLLNPSTGANNLVFTLANTGLVHGAAIEMTRVNQVTPFGTVATSITGHSVNVTAAVDDWVFGLFTWATNSSSATPGAGQTEIFDMQNSTAGYGGAEGSYEVATGTTVTMNTGSSPTDFQITIGVAVKGAGFKPLVMYV